MKKFTKPSPMNFKKTFVESNSPYNSPKRVEMSNEKQGSLKVTFPRLQNIIRIIIILFGVIIIILNTIEKDIFLFRVKSNMQEVYTLGYVITGGVIIENIIIIISQLVFLPTKRMLISKLVVDLMLIISISYQLIIVINNIKYQCSTEYNNCKMYTVYVCGYFFVFVMMIFEVVFVIFDLIRSGRNSDNISVDL